MYGEIDKLLFDEITVVKDQTSRKGKKSNPVPPPLESHDDISLQLSVFGLQYQSNISPAAQSIIRELIKKIHEEISRSTELRTKLQNQQQCLYDSIEENDQLKVTLKQSENERQIVLKKLQTIERTFRERLSKIQSDYQILMKQKVQTEKSRQFFNSEIKKKDERYEKLRNKLQQMDQRNLRLTHTQMKKVSARPTIEFPNIHQEKYTSLLQQNQQLKSILYHITQEITKTEQIREDLFQTRRELQNFNENIDTSNMTILLESKFVRAPLTTGRHAMAAFDSSIKKFQKLLMDIDSGKNYSVNEQDRLKIALFANIKNKMNAYSQIMNGYSQILRAFLNEATSNLRGQQFINMQNTVHESLQETERQMSRMIELTKNK